MRIVDGGKGKYYEAAIDDAHALGAMAGRASTTMPPFRTSSAPSDATCGRGSWPSGKRPCATCDPPTTARPASCRDSKLSPRAPGTRNSARFRSEERRVGTASARESVHEEQIGRAHV